MTQNITYFIIFIILCCAFAIQMYYYFRFFIKLALYKQRNDDNIAPKEPVSVIICARNEEENLKANLHLILNQDYPNFEVIVVDDCSEDNTTLYLRDLSAQYKHLQVVNLQLEDRFAMGKKFPLTLGIKRASNELLLLTDADCRPTGKQWLSTMQKNFVNGIDIVLGYAPYRRRKGLFNKIVRLDTFLIAVRYFSFSLSKITYMGVGRNMAYRKYLFFKNKGFASHYHIPSGDDDLFIHEVATKKNTSIEISNKSHVFSDAKVNFKTWFKQKKRHLVTGYEYKTRIKFLLTILPLSELVFYSTLAVLLILKYQLIIISSLFILRYIIQLFILVASKKKLKEKKLFLAFIPVFEIFYLFFYFLVIISNRFNKPKVWK